MRKSTPTVNHTFMQHFFGLLGVYSVATKQFIKAYCYWAVTLNFLDKIDSANQTCDSFAYRKLSMALHQVLPSLQSQK